MSLQLLLFDINHGFLQCLQWSVNLTVKQQGADLLHSESWLSSFAEMDLQVLLFSLWFQFCHSEGFFFLVQIQMLSKLGFEVVSFQDSSEQEHHGGVRELSQSANCTCCHCPDGRRQMTRLGYWWGWRDTFR